MFLKYNIFIVKSNLTSLQFTCFRKWQYFIQTSNRFSFKFISFISPFHKPAIIITTMDTDEPTLDNLIKALPTDEKVPVLALKKLLDQREAIDDEQEQNINQIKKKYNEKIKPLLQRASDIIKGGAITMAEVPNAQQFLKAGENVENFLKGKVIDNYWNGVFSNTGLVDLINEDDEKALSYLLDIQKVQNEEDLESNELKFIFKENPYFKEKQIKRKVVIKAGEALCVEGDKITWRQGQCLTYKLKKVTNKKTGEKSTVQGEKIESFFDIFLDWDKQKIEELARVADMLTEISSLVLLDSIDYFLGVINADQQSEDDEELDEDSEEK